MSHFTTYFTEDLYSNNVWDIQINLGLSLSFHAFTMYIILVLSSLVKGVFTQYGLSDTICVLMYANEYKHPHKYVKI